MLVLKRRPAHGGAWKMLKWCCKEMLDRRSCTGWHAPAALASRSWPPPCSAAGRDSAAAAQVERSWHYPSGHFAHLLVAYLALAGLKAMSAG